MELITGIISSTAIVNIILIGTIMRIVGKLYFQLKYRMSLGVLSFLGFLMLHNIIGASAYFLVHEFFSPEVFPYLLGITAAESVALLIYLKISFD